MSRIKEQTMVADGDTLIITDPCYLLRDEDWRTFGNEPYHFGIEDSDKSIEFLKTLGFGECIMCDTGYGDWSNHIKNTETGEYLGTFCADAGMVCVLTASDLTNYKVDEEKLNKYIENGAITSIPNFTGTIKAYSEVDEEGEFPFTLTVIEGSGDFNFSSAHIDEDDEEE